MLEQNEMENIVTPMMEDICDHLCRFPKEVTDQEAWREYVQSVKWESMHA